jgi:hypothetical protein
MARKNDFTHPGGRTPQATMSNRKLDPVLHDWIRIGSLAWSGHCTRGRGLVLVTVTEDGAEYRYCPGVPCDCHAHWIEQYDPEAEAVVLICRGDKESIYRIKATPSPRDAWAMDMPPPGSRVTH